MENNENISDDSPQEVLPVNRKVKDTFFKTVYASEKRQKELASFLLGVEIEKVEIANVRPVVYIFRFQNCICCRQGLR